MLGAGGTIDLRLSGSGREVRALPVALGLALLAVDPRIEAGYVLPKLVLLALGLWGLRVRRGGMDLAVLIGLGVLLLSTLFSPDPWQAVLGKYGDHAHGLWALGLAAGYLLLGAGAREKDYQALGLCVALVGAATFLQSLLGWQLRWGSRAGGPLGDPIATGFALAVGAPLCLTLGRRALRQGALLLVVLGLWATGNRGSAGAALAGLLVYGVMR